VFAAIHAASARRCRRTRSLCGSSEVRACSCVPTNTLESRRLYNRQLLQSGWGSKSP
jgi:hypothetical protein